MHLVPVDSHKTGKRESAQDGHHHNGTPEQNPHISDAEGRAMARAAVNLFTRWDLTDAQACTLLGGISVATYTRWKRGDIGRLGVDRKTRLSNLMGIHKALRLLFTDNDRVYGWVHRDNDVYGGRTALDIMLGGQLTDLMRVRRYLDAVRG
ncbi:MbcA/ParS/Xre antitoxin family protein [Eilatimonas milleporae]|uniref:Uncharacterized protein DUF2384 n=1 Tax=Eilatimonas milleporae TaxID=911205 RepID=A0A3M0CQQ3_9PROT|nr:MbcA/ParS/Xre antitoxin family protein [Eilatimonas milleporae]RMB11881.1 uncharacterized protein DUF2384 [Eilatimonas milleporae]